MISHYSTIELLEASGLTDAGFKTLVHREHFQPSSGRPGKGNDMQHSPADVVQAVFLARMGRAGVLPNRSSRFWRVIAAHECPLTLAVVLGPEGARIISESEVPEGARAIRLRDLTREVGNRLHQIDARRAATDPAAYPYRSAFAASDPAAPWSVFLADEAGELDAETVARICDAIEARSHLAIAARSQAALDSVVLVVRRMLATAPAETVSVH